MLHMRRPLALPPMLLLAALCACAGGREQQPLPPQTVTSPAVATQPAAIDPPEMPEGAGPSEASGGASAGTASAPETGGRAARAPSADAPKPADGSLLVLDRGTASPGVTTNEQLVRAAHKERERRRTVQPIAVVTDENLAEEAEGGNVTIANTPQADQDALEEARETLEEYREEESYWRSRARSIRERWREAHDSIGPLEDDAEELRRRFYAEEDVELRERDIKPAWDRTLELLAEARAEVEQAREDLDELYFEGRRAGVVEGWLREAIELEPEADGAVVRPGSGEGDADDPPPAR